uniref:VHS domain-containing protein n=1 Tax=Romanomermis culicivorax TaxID=13658 RepID=A0A915JX64_ROMCU
MEQAREAAQVVTEFFQGNPFGTHVGHMIEQATDESLPAENWALNMDICDAVNSLPDGGFCAQNVNPKPIPHFVEKLIAFFAHSYPENYDFTVIVEDQCQQRFKLPPETRSAPDQKRTTGSVLLNDVQLTKLRSELDIVNGNVKVLMEMLGELHPGNEDPEDLQLLKV